MPGPTVSGTRTSSWKYQAGHVFRRGQPVYLQSAAAYALASSSTGFDGVVGDVAVGRFELVTGGELDNLIGLVPNQIYSLGPTPGLVVAGSTYPIFKALAADTVSLISANTGTSGTDVVLPFTVSVTPIPNGVPQAGGNGLLDSGWIPTLSYEPLGAVADHNADFRSHSPYLVRSPEGGGILDIDEGSLVFDVDALTQVLDEAFI